MTFTIIPTAKIIFLPEFKVRLYSIHAYILESFPILHFAYIERSPWLQVFVIVQNMISFAFEKLCLVICKFYSKTVVRTKETTIQEALLLPWNPRSCHKVLPQIHTATVHAEWALELRKSPFQSLGWYLTMELDLQPPINSYAMKVS